MKTVRVLIVDDSPSMRALIKMTLSRDPRVQVVGQAADPLQAREAIKALNPDVMTLDVEMPRMNGLDFLERVMRLRPLPVVMVSSLTEAGASATLGALELGAVDCVGKPTIDQPNAFDCLVQKVLEASQSRVSARTTERSAIRASSAQGGARSGALVAIGASTGGVEALVSILTEFASDCAPTVVTLHLPTPFTKTFAERLDRVCAAKVREAKHGDPLHPGHVYIAPGSLTHLEITRSDGLRCALRQGDLVTGHRPSVDALFLSVAKTVGAKAVGVILTGMGGDGANGLLAMRDAGARTIGQDEASCVVYGMPRKAFQLGAVERQAPLSTIASQIAKMTSSSDYRT